MKKILCNCIAAIIAACALSSCHVMSLPYTRTASGPYVQTKDGKRYEGTSAERQQRVFAKDKIVLGDTTFLARDVAIYSTGGATFANVGKRLFAEQVAAGPVNLYKIDYQVSTTTTYGGGGMGSGGMGGGSSHTSSHKASAYFIQKDSSLPVVPLSYKNLRPMVEHRSAAFKLMEKCKTTRTVGTCFGFGGLGLVGGGIALASSGAIAGVPLIIVGLSALYARNINRYKLQNRLLQTVLAVDKVKGVKATHKRVK